MIDTIRLSVFAAASAVLLSTSWDCPAQIHATKKELIENFGQPLKDHEFKKDKNRDECMVFKTAIVGNDLIVVAYLKEGKTCWIGYGRKKKFDELGEPERLFILQANCGGSKWKQEVVRAPGSVKWSREDGQGFAEFLYKDLQRPFLYVMTKTGKESLEAAGEESMAIDWSKDVDEP